MQSTLTYEGPELLRANQLFRATLRVRLGQTVHAGGRIVIATRHDSDFGDAQMTDATAENHLEVTVDGLAVAWVLRTEDGARHPWNRGIELRLLEGELPAGAEVVLRLGAPDATCAGYRCQSFSETSFGFRLGIDAGGAGDWQVAREDGLPGFRIIGARAVGVRLLVTDGANAGEPLRVRAKVEDVYGNVTGEAIGPLRLLLDDAQPLGMLQPDARGLAACTLPRPSAPGYHSVTALSDDGGFFTRSNPFGPSLVAGHHLYWGEIHSQSGLCDGTNSPAELYAYAREAAGLDFASVTSHDFELTAVKWEEVKQATRAAHQPHRFVTLLGYEWSGQEEAGGDNNVYFLGDDGPLLYSAPCGGYAAWNPAGNEVDCRRTLAQLVADLAGIPAMIVPHCGGRLCNFAYYDPRIMPLLEMHSCHRNYEHIAMAALRRGLRFGFIGGSDDHRGAIGDCHLAARDRYFSGHNGLVAVYATELTREALWEAFFARRVYATNGARILLDFRIGETLLGGTLQTDAEQRLSGRFFVRTDGFLDHIELVRGSEVIERYHGPSNRVVEYENTFEFRALPGAVPYYLRVIQSDGGRAWSSPIWVDGRERERCL